MVGYILYGVPDHVNSAPSGWATRDSYQSLPPVGGPFASIVPSRVYTRLLMMAGGQLLAGMLVLITYLFERHTEVLEIGAEVGRRLAARVEDVGRLASALL